MTPPLSKVLDVSALPPGRPPTAAVLRAYGDPDDPLRLSVLLAGHLANLMPKGRDAAEACRDRRSTWRERHDALTALLDRAKTQLGGHFIALIDPDALAPAQVADDLWEDTAAYRARASFFELVMDSVDDGGWLLARTTHVPEVSTRMAMANVEEDTSTEPVSEALLPFSAEVRPTVQWLIDSGTLQSTSIERMTRTLADYEEHVLRIAYDALAGDVRDTARLLHVVRQPMHDNGALGEFAWGAGPTPSTVARESVGVLRQAGFLQCDDMAGDAQARMPRLVRRMLASYATIIDADRPRQTHDHLSTVADFDARSDEQQIEIHRHAACSGDVVKAKQTARFFGTELRALATRLSREEKRYLEAATLFRHVLDEFDRRDAYAWEYLGYNLARADSADGRRGHHRAEILEAYQEAHKLVPGSPLYVGRLIGYRAECNQDVGAAFDRHMTRFLRDYGTDWEPVSWFAMAVLNGLQRARRFQDRDRLLERWRTVLERAAPKVVLKHSAR